MATKSPCVVKSRHRVRLQVAKLQRGDAALFRADDFIHRRIEDELDLRIAAGPLLHDLRGAKLLAAMNDGDLAGELGEERRLLHRRVAAADDDDLLVLEEESVARGAVRHAESLQRFLARQSDLHRRRAGGDDERLRIRKVLNRS